MDEMHKVVLDYVIDEYLDDDEDGMDLSAISDEASPVVKMVNKIM